MERRPRVSMLRANPLGAAPRMAQVPASCYSLRQCLSQMAPLPIEPVLPRSARPSRTRARRCSRRRRGREDHAGAAGAAGRAVAGRRGAIVMLEPRRLAARAAAGRMAAAAGRDASGGTVGYRIRHETRVGRAHPHRGGDRGRAHPDAADRPGARAASGLVVFDEFHERSIHADLGLALTLQTRALLRDDLRVLVMSATLDGAPVARTARRRADRHQRGAELPGGDPLPAARARRAGRGRPSRQRCGRRWPGTRATSSPSCRAPREIRRAEALLGRRPLPTWFRCTAPCRRRCRTARSGPARRAAARWCSPPRSPRPASPSTACAWWWTAAWRGCRATRRAPA